MSFFYLFISLYSAITLINLKNKFFLDQTTPHQNYAISSEPAPLTFTKKIGRSAARTDSHHLLFPFSPPVEFPSSVPKLFLSVICHFCAHHPWSLTCSHFLHLSASVSTTKHPSFPFPTPIICMALVLTADSWAVLLSVFRGLHLFWHTFAWRCPMGSASQLHLLTLYIFSSSLFHSRALNTLHMSIILMVAFMSLTSPLMS